MFQVVSSVCVCVCVCLGNFPQICNTVISKTLLQLTV